MIVISDNSVAIWMIAMDTSHDFMMHLEEKSKGLFEIQSRLRTYDLTDPDPWSGKDVKRWLVHRIECSREIALARCRNVMRELELQTGAVAEEILACGMENFLEVLRKKKWIHMKTHVIRKDGGHAEPKHQDH